MKHSFSKRLAAAAAGAALCVGLLAGCGSSDDTPVVMTINGEEVHSSELAGYIVYNMAYYQQMGITMDMWAEQDMFDNMKESCKQQAMTYYAIGQLAEEQNIKLDSEDKAELDEQKKQIAEQYGGTTSTFKRWINSLKGEEDGFITFLNSMGYTEELYDYTSELVMLNDKLVEQYESDPSIEQTYNDSYLHAKHILIRTTDDSGQSLTGEELEKAEATAQEVWKKVQAGEDFDALVEQYNEDVGMPEDGYYFTEGDMMDEFYQGTSGCEVNEIYPEMVQTSYGYHIIQRLPLDTAALDSTDAYLNSDGETTIRTVLAQGVLDDVLQEKLEALDVQTNEEYDKITAYNVHTYVGYASDAMLTQGSGSAEGSR